MGISQFGWTVLSAAMLISAGATTSWAADSGNEAGTVKTARGIVTVERQGA